MTEVFDIVTIQNIDDEDFSFEYNRSEGNAPYLIPAGEIARYPSFLAKHAVKHLIDKILTKQDERVNHETKRAELMDKIIIDSETPTRKAEPTEAEALRLEVDKLNAPTTLESILSKRKAKREETKEEINTKPDMDKLPEEEEFEGLPKEESKEPKKEETVVKEEPKKEEKIKFVPKPTRNELFDYAEKQNLVLDEEDKDGKTLRQRLSKMKIDDIIKELDYPLEEK